MNTALIQPDPELQRSSKSGSINNNNNSHKLKNTTINDTHLLASTNNNSIAAKTLPVSSNATIASTTTATTTLAVPHTSSSFSGRGHGIYGHSLTASLSKIASSSRDYLYLVGSHGSLSTSYDAFFTDDGYNEAEQGGVMTVPYTNGPVEFEDSRFYEGRYEDGVHDEYEYGVINGSSHCQQQQQQQQQQPQLKFSEESMTTESTILAGNYRRHRQQSSTSLSIKQFNGKALPTVSLGSPLRYRDINSSSMIFGGRSEGGDKEEYRYHLPSQSQLFQPEFTGGMYGAAEYDGQQQEEESVMEDSNDNVMRDEETERKHNGVSWKQQPGTGHEIGQEELQRSAEDDDDDDEEEEDHNEQDAEADNDREGESEDGEDDDEEDEGGPGGTSKGRKKASRRVTSQKTLPKASVPLIQKEHRSQQQLYQQQAHQHDHPQSHSHSELHQQQQHQPHYQTQQQHQHSASSPPLSSSTSLTSTSSYHSSNFISEQQFLLLADDYLLSLSPKKREKALLSNSMYQKILMVLIQPKNTQVSTAQFRFWAKKMFTLSTSPTHHVVCHGGKPVATKECLYDVLVYCHRKSSHGGRDKTSAEVRQHYSWVPKELIARFVKHCPLCLSRRSTQQRQNGPSNSVVGGSGGGSGGSGGPSSSLSLDIDETGQSAFLDSHSQRFESDAHLRQHQHHHPQRQHVATLLSTVVSGGAACEKDRGGNDNDNDDADIDFQTQQQQQQHRFVGSHRGVPHPALSASAQQTGFVQQQQQSDQYGHHHHHSHQHAGSSSMQQTGYDALQSPNSPIGNTHEGSQPWAWREGSGSGGIGVGIMDLKDGDNGRGDDQSDISPASILISHHEGGVAQVFPQADDDGAMQVDRKYEHQHGLDNGHGALDHVNTLGSDTAAHQTETIHPATVMDPTRSSNVIHSGLYCSNNNNNQDAAFHLSNDDDMNGDSPSGMVGISQDLVLYDEHQYRDPALLHHQHHQQQQRLFQQTYHTQPHRHQYQGGQHSRHHPYQHLHQHRHRHASSNDSNNSMETRETQAPPVTVHPNGHILHDRHPIHNRARLMALANSAAAAATGTAGDHHQGQISIPPIHAIHQAALTLSQQYRHHHYHHHQQQQQNNQHGHHLSAAGSHFYHGHHSQQHQQQQSYRQALSGNHNQRNHHHNHHSGVVSGHPSAFMYTFTNPARQSEDDSESGVAYDNEGSEGSDEEYVNDDDHNIDEDDIDVDGEMEGSEDGQDDGEALLLSEGGGVNGQGAQMAD